MSQSRIHQMQMSFSPLEDRIIFRMNTSTHQEYLFWFTRRYTKLLWRAVQDMLEHSVQQAIPATLEPQVRQALQSFEHQKALVGADFSTQYQSSAKMAHPLGEAPVLLSKIRLKPGEDVQTLCLHPEQGQGIELAMNEQLLHSFANLLVKTLHVTDWDLSIFWAHEELPPPAGQKIALH